MDVNFQTPPLYPPLLAKSLPLDQNEKYKDTLSMKKKFRNAMQESVYYVENVRSEKADFNASIERFSDRYSKMKKADINKWKPDWNRLPKELKYFYEKGEKKVKRKITATTFKSTKIKAKKLNDMDVDKITEILKDDEEEEAEENEDAEETAKEKKKDKESGDEEENQGDELEDEEDIEEENDYIDAYFNNGEDDNDDDFGGGDDDGPTY